ncbi:hypothetical protein IFM89_016300 [Coptis chinensis]|uniref:Uncharacterized protein n=1 Tax=Coptis chinensis TaxID=261450 RepID=A0A835LEK6_9MAGN|nr:hypothetical protein IFM89_016300 [Coptis chinensis]
MHSGGSGISPYRSEAIQSPFHEGMGFLGIPKQVKSVKVNNSISYKDGHWGSDSLSLMVEKIVYVDSKHLQTSIAKSSSLDMSGMVGFKENDSRRSKVKAHKAKELAKKKHFKSRMIYSFMFDDDDDEGDFEDDKDAELLEKLSAIDKNLEDKLALLDHTIAMALGCVESLMPLHSAIAFASIAADSSCWSWLSQEMRFFHQSGHLGIVNTAGILMGVASNVNDLRISMKNLLKKLHMMPNQSEDVDGSTSVRGSRSGDVPIEKVSPSRSSPSEQKTFSNLSGWLNSVSPPSSSNVRRGDKWELPSDSLSNSSLDAVLDTMRQESESSNSRDPEDKEEFDLMRGIDDDNDEGDFEDDKDAELLEKLSAIDKNLEDKLALLDHTFGRKGRALEEEIKDLNDPILFALPGSQDTLLDLSRAHYFYQCYIQGSIDFSFWSARLIQQLQDQEQSQLRIGVWLWRGHKVFFCKVYNKWDWDDILGNSLGTVWLREYKCKRKGADLRRQVPWAISFRDEEARPFLDRNFNRNFINEDRWLQL